MLQHVRALTTFAAFAALLVGVQARAAEKAAGTGETEMASRAKFHLYLLIGQSNMAGRGKVAKEDTTPHPRVFKLDKKDEWAIAVDPLHFDKPMAGVGPGLTFGKLMAEADPSVKIGLIPCAAGGSPIRVWKKGGYWGQTRSKPYDETLRRVAVARRRGVLKAILWHQGESDGNPKDAPLYAERLDDLIARLRKDLRVPRVPFIAGGLSDRLLATRKEARAVDEALRRLPERVPHTAYVTAKALRLGRDRVHFSAPAARDLGRRYAQSLLALRPEGKPK